MDVHEWEVRVPQWRDFLDRFRPAGAPGAVARVAVPPDRSSQAAELGPVLALLDDTQAECQRGIAQAEADAVRIVTEARAAAAAIAADARRRARSACDEAVQHAMRAARAEARQAAEAAAQQAARERRLAAERIPALAGKAVGLVRGLPATPGPAPPGHDQPGLPGGQP